MNRIETLNRFEDVLRRIYISVKDRVLVNDVNFFTIENTVKIDDGFITTLFPLFSHGYSGVRDAIKNLNNLQNSNSGDGLVLVFSATQSSFYLLFKNLGSFVEAFQTIHEELKKLYTSEMYKNEEI